MFSEIVPSKIKIMFPTYFYDLDNRTMCPWQEEVEIEAKVVADKKKDNGELIALGKQWMATPTLKVKLGEMSKLWAQTNETQNAFWFFFGWIECILVLVLQINAMNLYI